MRLSVVLQEVTHEERVIEILTRQSLQTLQVLIIIERQRLVGIGVVRSADQELVTFIVTSLLAWHHQIHLSLVLLRLRNVSLIGSHS